MRILHLDIETSPILAHVWGLWQQNVSLKQIAEVTEVLCWAAKWDGEDEVLFSGLYDTTREDMITKMWHLLDEADAVVHYNGKRFDIPHLNREFVELGLTPPSPYKQIDLLQTAKRQFRLPSNKLDYVASWLGLGGKFSHTGFDLWLGCMNGDQDSWDMMETYNRHDVVLTEQVYHALLPWIIGHPQRGLYTDEKAPVCRCGGTNFKKKGYAYTAVSKYQRYVCRDCGTNQRGRKNLADKSKEILSNVAG